MAFDAAWKLEQLAPGQFGWTVPDGWQQGRGAFGGLVLGALVRAAERTLQDPDRPLRSITGELCGPTLVGEALIKVEVLRAGNNLTTLAVRLEQQQEIQAHAVLIFGNTRPQPLEFTELWPPEQTPWETLEPLPMIPAMPSFARRMEYRLDGLLPYSQEPSARTHTWVRPRETVERWDAATLVAMSDAVWPSFMNRMEAPRPMGTVSYMAELLDMGEGLELDQPLYHRGHTIAAHAGYQVELRELWGADGRLMLLNQQCLVLIK